MIAPSPIVASLKVGANQGGSDGIFERPALVRRKRTLEAIKWACYYFLY